jgi:hypothetical protein
MFYCYQVKSNIFSLTATQWLEIALVWCLTLALALAVKRFAIPCATLAGKFATITTLTTAVIATFRTSFARSETVIAWSATLIPAFATAFT